MREKFRCILDILLSLILIFQPFFNLPSKVNSYAEENIVTLDTNLQYLVKYTDNLGNRGLHSGSSDIKTINYWYNGNVFNIKLPYMSANKVYLKIKKNILNSDLSNFDNALIKLNLDKRVNFIEAKKTDGSEISLYTKDTIKKTEQSSNRAGLLVTFSNIKDYITKLNDKYSVLEFDVIVQLEDPEIIEKPL